MVFFVHRQANTAPQLYTLWATSEISKIDDYVSTSGKSGEDGFSFMYFVPFQPLPVINRVHGLSAKDLVGNTWGSGNHRYLTTLQENKLRLLI